MTVVTTRSPASAPRSCIAIAHAASTWSPSITLPARVGEQRPVGVAVVRHAGVGAQPDDLGGDDVRVERAAPDVDVVAVGAVEDRVHVGAEPAQQAWARAPTPRRSRSRPRPTCPRAIPRTRPPGAPGSVRARSPFSLTRPGSRAGPDGSASSASISSSSSSESFVPSREKNLMPLSSGGLCEAEITTPDDAWSSVVRNAIAGVGSTPARITSPPADRMPSDERLLQPDPGAARVAPHQERRAVSRRAVRGRRRPHGPDRRRARRVSSVPATPRTPSVPKSRPTAARLPEPAAPVPREPGACGSIGP